MWWNRIIEWFTNNKERNSFIQDFNKSAKEAFISNLAPVYLKAESLHCFTTFPLLLVISNVS